jgi:hypothetical protein
LEHPHRSALENHVHRTPRLGNHGLLNVRIGIRADHSTFAPDRIGFSVAGTTSQIGVTDPRSGSASTLVTCHDVLGWRRHVTTFDGAMGATSLEVSRTAGAASVTNDAEKRHRRVNGGSGVNVAAFNSLRGFGHHAARVPAACGPSRDCRHERHRRKRAVLAV